jgi:hypothetical protein
MTHSAEKRFLFLAALLFYALTSPGDMIGDTSVRWAVASRIAQRGRFDIPPDLTFLSTRGPDGRTYSFYGPGQSFCLVPFVWAGEALAKLPLPGGGSAKLYGQFLASVLLFPAFGAVTVLLVYAIATEVGGDRRAARWVAVLTGVATMHWHSSVNTYEETQVAAGLLAGTWALLRYRRRPGLVYLVLAMAAFGAAVAFRISAVVPALAIAMVGMADELIRCPAGRARLHRFGRWALGAMIGLGPFLLALGAYNVARFGSPLKTGYVQAHQEMGQGISLFRTPLWFGLTGMLFSPGKSVFLYNPILLLAVPGLFLLHRSHRWFVWVTAAAFAASVLFHAKYTFWSGDLAWGPRYLASLMGLLCVGLLPILRRRGAWRSALVALASVSVIIQLASVTYSFGLEYFQDRRHGPIPDEYVWRVRESQLLCRFRNVALHVAGRPDYRSIPPGETGLAPPKAPVSPERVRLVHAVQAFPFKALAAGTGNGLFHALLGIWVALLLALGATTFLWVTRARASGRDAA